MNRKHMIKAGATAVTLVAVVTGTALASNGAEPTDAPAATDTDTDEVNEQEPALNGSITAPEDESDGIDGQSEADEAATLSQLDGLISEVDAIAAATADGGTADAATLENENGSVVYEVEVTLADGTVEEVKVDAGTGDVLAREADDEGDDD